MLTERDRALLNPGFFYGWCDRPPSTIPNKRPKRATIEASIENDRRQLTRNVLSARSRRQAEYLILASEVIDELKNAHNCAQFPLPTEES